MSKHLSEILTEWSYRVSDGLPDASNRAKLLVLEDVLKYLGWSREGAAELMYNLTEEKKYTGKGVRTGKPGAYKYDYGEPSSKPDGKPDEKPSEEEPEEKPKVTKKELNAKKEGRIS